MTPATVAWWEYRPDGHLTSWLVVGPGSPPCADQAWVAQMALGPRRPGEWAVVVWAPIWELGPGIAQRLHDPLGPGRPGLGSVAFARDGTALGGTASAALYDECRSASLRLVGRSVYEIVPTDVQDSGILLMRLVITGAKPILQIAPVVGEPLWFTRAIELDFGPLVWSEDPPHIAVELVDVAGSSSALPCARFQVASGIALDHASVRVGLPGMRLPGAPVPTVDLALACDL